MRKTHFVQLAYNACLTGVLLLAAASGAHGQFRPFTQNRDTIKIDPSGFPVDIKKGYDVFRVKCNECHGLDTSLKPSLSAAQWTFEVKRMQAMASSHFNDAEAKAILDFLNYDETHRKALNKPTTQAAPQGTASAGRQFYDAQGCETCHAIGGKGGTSGPSLSDVGKRLSPEKLTEVIQGLRADNPKSAMPPLPSSTTDQQVKDLIDFLLTLKGE